MSADHLNIPLRKLLCCEDTPGGPCCLRPAHEGSHLPMPDRGGVAVGRGHCKCSHPRSAHYRDRRGRPKCDSAACGCLSYRPREEPTGGAA